MDLTVRTGKTLGIIGESGCGKSVTAHSILNTVQAPGKVEGGSVMYRTREGKEVDLAAEAPNSKFMRSIRGREISMIFQEPMTSMSPVYTIGQQMTEAYLTHQPKVNRAVKKEAEERAIEMLKRVGMQNPEQRMNAYPHQLSGGMCQRAMIAMALMLNPRILIADEPTTALDVTVQAQITDLMLELQETMGMSMIYITHDMGVISEVADDICVMYLGRVMEQGTAEQIFLIPHASVYRAVCCAPFPSWDARCPALGWTPLTATCPCPLTPRRSAASALAAWKCSPASAMRACLS